MSLGTTCPLSYLCHTPKDVPEKVTKKWRNFEKVMNSQTAVVQNQQSRTISGVTLNVNARANSWIWWDAMLPLHAQGYIFAIFDTPSCQKGADSASDVKSSKSARLRRQHCEARRTDLQIQCSETTSSPHFVLPFVSCLVWCMVHKLFSATFVWLGECEMQKVIVNLQTFVKSAQRPSTLSIPQH